MASRFVGQPPWVFFRMFSTKIKSGCSSTASCTHCESKSRWCVCHFQELFGCARRSLAEDDGIKPETFIRTQWVISPARKGWPARN